MGYEKFKQGVYDTLQGVPLHDMQVGTPLRTVVATTWDYLSGGNCTGHLAVLSQLGEAARGLKEATLFRLGKRPATVSEVDSATEPEMLYRLCKKVEADSLAQSAVSNKQFSRFKNLVLSVVVDNYHDEQQAALSKNLGNLIVNKVTILSWKRLGGDVMYKSYSDLFHIHEAFGWQAQKVRDWFMMQEQKEAKEPSVKAWSNVLIHKGNMLINNGDFNASSWNSGPVDDASAYAFLQLSGSTPQTCTIQPLQKENTMKAIETITYVYGNNVTEMTDQQLIAAIKKAEGERDALNAVKTVSKKVKALQAEWDAAISDMVEILDARA
jgi:hypothetical protein